MRLLSALALAVLALAISACDLKSPGSSKKETPPDAPAAGDETGDLGLGRDWVKTMLEENDATLARMQEDLARLRRELDRVEASPAQDRMDDIKKGMVEILDRQESELRKLNDQAEEMRKVMAAEPRG
jgi:tRNA(Phe) wybutosine-synthesizing methylase Tyw3